MVTIFGLTPIRGTSYLAVLLVAVVNACSLRTTEKARADEPSQIQTADKDISNGAAESAAVTAEPTAPQSPVIDYDPQVVTLYENKQLLEPEQYPALRKLVAQRFAKEHNEKIRKTLGADYDEMMDWFESHPNIHEEFCCAVDEKYDNVTGAFSVLNQIRKAFPDATEKYHNLAIATALVWDDGSVKSKQLLDGAAAQARARYDHTKGTGALDNFAYFVDNEDYMQGRALNAPWEVLVYIVYQRTPMGDRKWVLETYGKNQASVRKAYFKVPYDNSMWSTRFKKCRLRGKEYTLSNILAIGGVCVQRSDFCSRVAMNLAIPASRVEGKNDDTFNHEWFTWVDLKEMTDDSVSFKINEAGRAKNDHYYIGRMTAPQNGRRLFQYEFALDFEVLRRSIIAKRQMSLALRVYPWIAERAALTGMQKIELVEAIIEAEPLNRHPWFHLGRAVSKLRGQEQYKSKVHDLMVDLTTTFQEYPDITWRVGAGMISYFDDLETQQQMYEQLATSFESMGRLDLVCESHLACAQILVQQQQPTEAISLLANCAYKYPDEGRYAPRMLDKIEEISAAAPGTATELVKLYQAYLPRFFKMQRGKPVKYTQNMYDRAVKVFIANGELKLAAEAEEAYNAFKEKKKKA